ncbi:uncharacterized protein LOC135706613 [Ochlerotatus camptorhynchus]|uniref:uncharacterized protein LOC135706613 n=1 Tax=Ochlerotatus camptorhynchus TaxID=644619 RepID=UPI0031DA0364
MRREPEFVNVYESDRESGTDSSSEEAQDEDEKQEEQPSVSAAGTVGRGTDCNAEHINETCEVEEVLPKKVNQNIRCSSDLPEHSESSGTYDGGSASSCSPSSPLKEQLDEWKLSNSIYVLLKEKGLEYEDLKQVSIADVNELFEPCRTGEKFRLLNKLRNWPSSAQYQPAKEICSKLNFAKSQVQAQDLDRLLNVNEKGKIIMRYYSKYQTVNKVMQKELSQIIVDSYIAQGKNFPVADMDKFAELIVAKLGSERKETYLCPRDKSIGKINPSGLLYHQYYNSSDRKALQSPRKKKVKLQNSNESDVSNQKYGPEDLVSLKEDQAWLQNNNTPLADVKEKWKKTYPFRLQMIKEIPKAQNKISKLLESWPRFGDSEGPVYKIFRSDINFISIY